MNAKDRHQRANAILDTLRNAEGQLDNLTMVCQADGNHVPEEAKDYSQQLKKTLSQAITDALNWIDYERAKLA